MSKIADLCSGVLSTVLIVKICKKQIIKNPKSGSNIYKTLLTDGVELLQIVQFGTTSFLKTNENDSVKLSSFMPRESKKDGFWIRFNAKNLHIESNSASKILACKDSISSVEIVDISTLEHMSITEKCLISVEAVLSHVKEDIFGEKKRITCRAYDLTGSNYISAKYNLYLFTNSHF